MTAMSCKKYQRKVTYSTRIPDFHEYSAVSLTSTTKNDLILFDCLFYLVLFRSGGEADICNSLRCLLDLVKNKNVTETSRKGG